MICRTLLRSRSVLINVKTGITLEDFEFNILALSLSRQLDPVFAIENIETILRRNLFSRDKKKWKLPPTKANDPESSIVDISFSFPQTS